MWSADITVASTSTKSCSGFVRPELITIFVTGCGDEAVLSKGVDTFSQDETPTIRETSTGGFPTWGEGARTARRREDLGMDEGALATSQNVIGAVSQDKRHAASPERLMLYESVISNEKVVENSI